MNRQGSFRRPGSRQRIFRHEALQSPDVHIFLQVADSMPAGLREFVDIEMEALCAACTRAYWSEDFLAGADSTSASMRQLYTQNKIERPPVLLAKTGKTSGAIKGRNGDDRSLTHMQTWDESHRVEAKAAANCLSLPPVRPFDGCAYASNGTMKGQHM